MHTESLSVNAAVNPAIPEGYCRDSKGRLVHETAIRDIDKLRTQTVDKIVELAKKKSDELRSAKLVMMSDVQIFVDLSAERYGVQLGGSKGNITLMSFDGLRKVVLQRPDVIAFDERLQVARQLIDECLDGWTEGAHGETQLRSVIDSAFAANKAGQIDAQRVLGLRRLDIKDEKWLRAMDAIAEAITVVGRKAYIRVYERLTPDGEWTTISLDLATV